MKFQSTWSRREFVTAIAGGGAAIMLKPFATFSTDDTDQQMNAIVATTISVDTHNHIDVLLITPEVPGPDIDLAGEMKRSGLSVIYA